MVSENSNSPQVIVLISKTNHKSQLNNINLSTYIWFPELVYWYVSPPLIMCKTWQDQVFKDGKTLVIECEKQRHHLCNDLPISTNSPKNMAGTKGEFLLKEGQR